MKKFSLLILLMFSVLASYRASAQTLNVVSVSEQNDRNNFYTIMKEAFPLAYNDPVAPRFIFFDDSRNFIFGMGGYVQLTGVYDFNGVTDYNYFTTSSIALKDHQPSSSYGMTIGQSRLFFKLLGDTDMGKVATYLEMEFEGEEQTPILRQAFFQLDNWLVGKTWSTFCDLAAVPTTIDEEGPSSAIEVRQPQIRYTYDFTDRISASLALEYVVPSYTTVTDEVAYIRQRIPDIPLVVTYKMKNGHLRAGGILRNVSYKDLVKDDDKIKTGWGATVSGAMTFASDWKVMFQGVYGKGIANYIQDINGLGYDMIPDGSSGKLKTPGMWGAFGGVQYSKGKLQSTLTYSYARLEGCGSLGGTTYKYAQYAAINALYNVSEFGTAGLEYVFGRRNDFNKDYGNASRINMMLQYRF